MKKIKRQAQSLIEYGLILALVAVVAVTILGKFSSSITNVGNQANTAVNQSGENAMRNYCIHSAGCTGYSATTGQCTGCP